MSKYAIPAVPTSSAAQGRTLFDMAVKENIEILTGRRGSKLVVLESNATLAEVIDKINAIITQRL